MIKYQQQYLKEHNRRGDNIFLHENPKNFQIFSLINTINNNSYNFDNPTFILGKFFTFKGNNSCILSDHVYKMAIQTANLIKNYRNLPKYYKRNFTKSNLENFNKSFFIKSQSSASIDKNYTFHISKLGQSFMSDGDIFRLIALSIINEAKKCEASV